MVLFTWQMSLWFAALKETSLVIERLLTVWEQNGKTTSCSRSSFLTGDMIQIELENTRPLDR
jgi:hypothetical protein